MQDGISYADPRYRGLALLHAAWLVLHAVPLVTDTPRLWGLDALRYLPWWAATMLLMVGCIPLCPSLVNPLTRGLTGAVARSGPGRTPGSGIVLLLAGSAALCAAFYIFRARTALLGDGGLWLTDLPRGPLYEVEEPLNKWVHSVVYGALRVSLNTAPEAYVRVVAALCGGGYAAVTVALAKREGTCLAERLFLAGLLATTGMVALFFGYIETYALPALLVTAYVAAALAALRNGRRVPAAALWLGTAIAFHPSAVALVPSLVYLQTAVWKQDARSWGRAGWAAVLWAAPILLAVTVLLAGGQTWAGLLGEVGRGERLLPIVLTKPNHLMPYGLRSWRHAWDVMNLWVLIAPALPLCLAAAVLSRSAMHGLRDTRLWLLGWMTMGYVISTVSFHMVIGAARDWDLFSPAAVPATLFAGVLVTRLIREAPGAAIPLLLAGTGVHSAAWVLLNAYEPGAVARFAHLTERSNWAPTAYGYATEWLGEYHRRRNEHEQAIGYFREALHSQPDSERYRQNLAAVLNNCAQEKTALEPQVALTMFRESLQFQDNPLVHRNLANLYFQMDRFDEAAAHFAVAARARPQDVSAAAGLASAWFKLERWNDAIAAARTVVTLDPGHRQAWQVIADASVRSGALDDGIAAYRQLVTLSAEDPVIWNNLGAILTQTGRDAEAREAFEKALSLDAQAPLTHYHLTLVLSKIGDFARALHHARQAAVPGYDMRPLIRRLETLVQRDR